VPKTTLNTGLRGGLFERKHVDKMGMAIWLFGWLVLKQTRPDGRVLGGKIIDYEYISKDTGYSERTLQRWMATLRNEGYIDLEYRSYKRMVIRVLKPKKSYQQKGLFETLNSATSGGYIPPEVADKDTKSGGFNKSRVFEHSKPEQSNTKKRAFSALLFAPPIWVPRVEWDGFVEMRQASKHPLNTERQCRLVIAKMEKLGGDPAELLNTAVEHGWRTVFPVPNSKNGNNSNRTSESEQEFKNPDPFET
jgi:hypothetical protein